MAASFYNTMIMQTAQWHRSGRNVKHNLKTSTRLS